MATVDTIRRITIQASTTGVDTATDSLNKLADAQKNVGTASGATATVTDTSASKQLSAQGAYDKLRTSIDSQYKSQQQLARGQSVLTNALNQGIITTATYAQMHELLNAKYGQSTTLSQAFSSAIGGVKTQMIALSAGMGPVGVLLAGFGPAGLAGAAGVALITSAIDYMVTEANRMGDVAQQVRNVSEVTGLATGDLQKLYLAGASVGMSNQQVGQSFERFEVQIGSLHEGTGQLYTDLMKINPALALQMASTRDATSAWNLLAQAYVQADQQQQATLAHAAAGGRGGSLGAGNLLAATAAAGGIQGLSAPASLLPKDEIDQWANLRTQIEEAKSDTENLMASTWTSEVLQRELQAAQYAERVAAAVKGIADQQSKMGWFDALMDKVGRFGLAEGGMQFPDMPQSSDAPSINLRRPAGGSYDNPFDSGGFDATGAMAALNSSYKERISLLGDAATATEKYQERVNALNMALTKSNGQPGSFTQQDYNRGMSAASLDLQISQTSAYVGALGPMVTIEDAVTQATQRLQRAQQQGAHYTQDQIDGVRISAQATAEWGLASQQASVGVFDLGSVSAATADQLKAWQLQGLLDPKNPLQMANAVDILAARMRALQQSAEDANPATKALFDLQFQRSTATMSQGDAAAATTSRQLYGNDWQDHLNEPAPQMAAMNENLKESSSLASSFADSFAQGMARGETSAKVLTSALQGLENQLMSMVSKQLVNQLFYGAAGGAPGSAPGGAPTGGLYSLFGSMFGTSSTLAMSNSFATGANPSDLAYAFHSGGIVGDGGAPRYIHPAYFDDAPRFHSGGLAGDEVPIIAQRGEGVLTRAQMAAMGGGSPNVNVNVVNNHSSAGVGITQQKRADGGVDIYATITDTVNRHLASGGADGVLRSRFGVALRPKPR